MLSFDVAFVYPSTSFSKSSTLWDDSYIESKSARGWTLSSESSIEFSKHCLMTAYFPESNLDVRRDDVVNEKVDRGERSSFGLSEQHIFAIILANSLN